MQTIKLELPEETLQQLQNISKEIAEIKLNLQPKEPKKYYSRQDVAKLFNVTLGTVHNWCQKGVLKPLGIGSRVYFERTVVEKTLVELKN